MNARDATVPAARGGEAAQHLALGALDWLLGSASSTGTGLTWAAVVPGAEPDMSLYHGSAGIVLALLEAHRHFGTTATRTPRCAAPRPSPPRPVTRRTARCTSAWRAWRLP